MKCLIVEDEAVTRKLLESLLGEFGSCDVATDGQEAYNMFCAARDSNAPYKLICLDIVMPEADGHEVLKAIRDLESEAGQVGDSSTKVIMVSGVTAGEDGYEAYSSGCDAYLVKPIDRQKLVQQLRHFDLIGEEIEL